MGKGAALMFFWASAFRGLGTLRSGVGALFSRVSSHCSRGQDGCSDRCVYVAACLPRSREQPLSRACLRADKAIEA